MAIVIIHHLALMVRDVSNRHADRLAFALFNANGIFFGFVYLAFKTFILTAPYRYKIVSDRQLHKYIIARTLNAGVIIAKLGAQIVCLV